MKKISILYLLLFVSTTVVAGANTTFTQTGILSEESGHSETMVISNKVYKVDSNTIVHALIRHGELGPQLPEGELIGFNTKQEDDSELPYVTEIWLLNAN